MFGIFFEIQRKLSQMAKKMQEGVWDWMQDDRGRLSVWGEYKIGT